MLAAAQGDEIVIPDDQQWGVFVEGGGVRVTDDRIGGRGHVIGIDTVIESADDIVVGVEVEAFDPSPGAPPVAAPPVPHLPPRMRCPNTIAEIPPTTSHEDEIHQPDVVVPPWERPRPPLTDYEHMHGGQSRLRRTRSCRQWSSARGERARREAAGTDRRPPEPVRGHSESRPISPGDDTAPEVMFDDMQGLAEDFGDAVQQQLADGYFVRNGSVWQKIKNNIGWRLNPNYNDPKGGQCGEFGEWGKQWLTQFVRDRFGDRAIVNDLYVEEPSSRSGRPHDAPDAIFEVNHQRRGWCSPTASA